MATGQEVQNPPILDDNTNYQEWIKDLKVWQLFTSTANTKKGPRLYLCLKGKAREIVREMDINEIGAEDGLEQIVAKLDSHYKKDRVQRAYVELENFEKFRRKSDMKITEYVSEFERLITRSESMICNFLMVWWHISYYIMPICKSMRSIS